MFYAKPPTDQPAGLLPSSCEITGSVWCRDAARGGCKFAALGAGSKPAPAIVAPAPLLPGEGDGIRQPACTNRSKMHVHGRWRQTGSRCRAWAGESRCGREESHGCWAAQGRHWLPLGAGPLLLWPPPSPSPQASSPLSLSAASADPNLSAAYCLSRLAFDTEIRCRVSCCTACQSNWVLQYACRTSSTLTPAHRGSGPSGSGKRGFGSKDYKSSQHSAPPPGWQRRSPGVPSAQQA